jgi:pantoate--beta-alanine ligase
MKTIINFEELNPELKKLTRPIGFVPTMGYLHDGHLSLARRAREECASVVASIFVNPTQFGPQEDLSRYPRDLPRDLSMLESIGVDLTWTPTVEEIYPRGFNTWVEVEGLTSQLEGEQRPGHFRGVATVVAKLFNLVGAQKAYFGQKDAQQVAVIRKMASDLNFPVEIVACPTVREKDGLAMSSRNIYLHTEERKAASVLFRALMAAKKKYINGERGAENLRTTMEEILASESLARKQYVSCADIDSLEELNYVVNKALLSLAVVIGKTRLIDNLILEE